MILIQAGKGGSMKYKHIVFDIDGTLIDTEYAVLHSLQETIKGLSEREHGRAPGACSASSADSCA